MSYFYYLPSLLCGIALSISDIMTRRIPRLWVALGLAFQLVTIFLWDIQHPRVYMLSASCIGALLAAGLQYMLALVRPGALGLGDVTACALAGSAVGTRGIDAFVLWWILMGCLGLVELIVWRILIRAHPTWDKRMPFVPVIILAAIISVRIV